MNVTSLPPRPTLIIVLESSIATVFLCLALAGNLIVCLAISRHKLLRTVPNFLLLNLAVTDILSAVVSLPLLVSVLVNGAWKFSKNVCNFQAFQSYASYSCSLLTLAVTSITRYYATVHPVQHRSKFKLKTVCQMIFLIWLASLLFASAPLLGWGNYKFEPYYGLCIHDHNSSPLIYNTFLFIFLIVNSTVIVACYSKIFKAMKTRRGRVDTMFTKDSCPRQLGIFQAQEVRLTKTIFIVICLFTLCYLPTIVLGFLMFTEVGVPRFARTLSTFSVAFTSVVNPAVYWIRSKTFRDALKGLSRGMNFRAPQDSVPVETSDSKSLELFPNRDNQDTINRRQAPTLPAKD